MTTTQIQSAGHSNCTDHSDRTDLSARSAGVFDAEAAQIALPVVWSVLDAAVRCAALLEEEGGGAIAAGYAAVHAAEARDRVGPPPVPAGRGVSADLVADPERVVGLVRVVAERLACLARAAEHPGRSYGWFQAAAEADIAADALATAARRRREAG